MFCLFCICLVLLIFVLFVARASISFYYDLSGSSQKPRQALNSINV